MKITILTKNLKSALENLTAVIEKRSTLPILKMVSFKSWEKTTKVGTPHTNENGYYLPMLEMVATGTGKRLKIDLTCDIAEAGEVCIGAARLLAICKKTKSHILEIETAGEVATVKAGEVIFKLEARKFEEFPILTADLPILGELEGFGEKLEFASEAMAAKVAYEVRYYLKGVNLKSNGDDLEFAATNGHLLLKTSLKSPFQLEKADNIIPRDAVKAILKIFKGKVAIGCDGKKIKIIGDEGEFISKLIDGTFPEVERVIPKGEVVFSYEINTKELAAAIKQIMPNDKNKSVFFEFGEKLKLDTVEGTISIPCGGENYKTAFNGDYILKICKFGNFTMDFKEGQTVATIKNSQGLGVIMPLNI